MKNHLKKVFYSGVVAFAMFFALALVVFAMPRPQEVVKATNLWADPSQVYINSAPDDTNQHFKDNKLYWTATDTFIQETTHPDAEYDPENGVLKVYMYGNTVQNSINSISVKGGDAAVDLVIQFEYDEGDYGFSWAYINFNGSITNQTGGNLTFVVGEYIEENENFGQVQVLGSVGTTGDVVIGEKIENFSICPQPTDEYAIKAHNLTINGAVMEIDTTGSNVDGVAAFDLSGNLNVTDSTITANVGDETFIHFANANCRANVANSEIMTETQNVEKLANYDSNFYKYADKCKYDILEDEHSFMLVLEPLADGELNSIQVSYDPGEGTGTAQGYESVAYGNTTTALTATSEDYNELLKFTAPTGKRLVRWAVNDAEPRNGLCVEQGAAFVVKYKTDFVALWEYAVTFEANGATGNYALALGAVLDGNNTITLPANPYTYEGKRFMGWAVGNPDADPQNAGAEIEITGQTTIYATWQNEYAVTYDANAVGATGEMTGATILANGTFTLDNCGFVADGKRFIGWGVNNDSPAAADLKQPGAVITITGETTIYAIWVNVYNVAYDANLLVEYTGEMNGSDVDEGTLFELAPCAFEAAGKQFVGWAIGTADATPLKQAGDTFAVTSHTIVYAVWMDVYKIHYNPTIGSGEEVSYGDFPSGTHHTLKTAAECGFTAPENYEFGGWMIGATPYDEGDEITITEETYVDAVWNRTLFTITFVAGDGGYGEMNDVTKNKNETYTLPANGFTPNGRKHFVGWSVGGQTKQPGAVITITADTEITALWVTWFEVFFDQGGAMGIMDNVEVDEGTKLVLPEPTFTPVVGTRFKAWSFGGEYYNPGDEVDIVEDNTHITAVWIPLNVEERLDVDDAKAGVDVTELFADAKAEGQEVTFVVDGISLAFNNDAVQSIGGHATTLTVDVSTNVKNTHVKGAQKVLTLSLSNNVFADGTAQGLVRVVVPVDELKAEGKEVKIYYLSPDGEKIDVEAVYEDGKATFETRHFSQYVLAFEGAEPAKISTWQIILIVLAASVVCGFAGIAIFLALKKKK